VTQADGRDHWFEGLADHMGAAYLRYSFTRGTDQEVAALVDALELQAGERVLDVGCGPGRHAHALARQGIEVVGIDISQRFVDLANEEAPEGARFERADARHLDYEGEFDAAISLCQGAFGLAAGPAAEGSTALDPDLEVLSGMARAVRPGGRIALSAFSAYFQLRYLEEGDVFDAAAGVNHERTVVRSEQGVDADVDLWTSCFTPRELRLMVHAIDGLELRELWSVTPGEYRPAPPDIDHPEWLLIADRTG
jgi:SAM-dependent methyltransferase